VPKKTKPQHNKTKQHKNKTVQAKPEKKTKILNLNKCTKTKPKPTLIACVRIIVHTVIVIYSTEQF